MSQDPGSEKLDELAARIRQAKGPTENQSGDSVAGPLRAGNTGYEFVGTVLACTLIGWLLDRYLHTKPWGILVMLLIGFAAGIMNIWRALNGYDQSVGLHKQDEK